MKKSILVTFVIAVAFAALTLAACLGADRGWTDTTSCPPWNVNDSLSYSYKLIVAGWTVDSEYIRTLVVTERTADGATIQSNNKTKTISIIDGRYITDPTVEIIPDVLGAGNNQFCPPPAIDDQYAKWTLFPGPVEETGSYFETTWTVTGTTIETLSVPAGSFTARKISLVPADPTALPNATLTRYYIDGLGIVKEVEVVPSNGATETSELASYGFQ